ncbi:hypothetical protein [uncultured Sphingomonas sp.]|uniref:hypothetical protein n=1 Tax=uncultured Sphingomonas sp. TaxID=158754 RepID=UPI0025E37DEE|nr:hypothetical protein [uncultured Sphingomonas sp.]
MTQALADLFADAQSPQLVWDGEMAYAIYEVSPAPETLTVEFLNAINAPVQGLTLKVNGGVLDVNGTESPEMLLWRDTAPDTVVVRVKSEPGARTACKLWNIWRGSMSGVDVAQAWLGNAGMRIEQSGDGNQLLLRCSDGEGPVDFNNLEVRVTLA